jgi:uncharacterized protein YrzB (UPF0473 family)
MRNELITTDESGKEIKIEIVLSFKIDEINKNYVAYTINDDGKSETVDIFISEIVYDNDVPRLVSIPDNEKNMALLFYNNIKKNI